MASIAQRIEQRTGRRSYEQACAVARGLDVVGERWTLLLVRELLFGPRRFGELLEALAGIGPNLLSARLKSLSEEGLVRRVPLRGAGSARRLQALGGAPAAESAGKREQGSGAGNPGGNGTSNGAGNGIGYELTESGRALEGVVLELARWELRRPVRAPGKPSDAVLPEWAILAWKARFEPSTSSGVAEVYRVDCEGRSFRLAVAGGALEATVGADPDAAVVLELDAATFARLGLGEVSLEAAAAAGQVVVRGSPFAVARLARVFRLEEEAPK